MSQPALKLVDSTTRKRPRRTGFTKTALERLAPPDTGETLVYDTKVKGLCFRLRPSSTGSFYLYRKHRGRPIRMKLGTLGDMTVEKARKAATAAISEFNAGRDPMADRRTERGELTIGELWKVYLAEHLEPRCSPRTVRAESGLVKKHLKTISTRRLSDVSPAMVKRLHAKIGTKSKTSANRSIQLLRRLYRYAARHHGHEGRIPTAGVELFREHARERFLSADELPRFLEAADAEGQPWSDFFRLCLATGARRSNVQAMRWADLDLPARRWSIPGDQSKNGRTMTVPLTAPAVEIVTRRKAEQADAENDRIRESEYVFPVLRNKGKAAHLSQPARPFARICKRAKIKGATIHDLRRTCGAFLAASGVSLPIIGKALGHADLRATQIYARLDLDPVAAAMEGASAAMNGKGAK